ncbi:hypothetical protein SRABI133_04184 [Peribacillus simplex]|uniref:Uncharacterized protein n=1 Tax=Peribacillus simplex TaxID=1478 RepID=A0A9W4PGP1_9BACI|nr:hypothetical protein SRABI133_04184 [Peribacillus simplex]
MEILSDLLSFIDMQALITTLFANFLWYYEISIEIKKRDL